MGWTIGCHGPQLKFIKARKAPFPPDICLVKATPPCVWRGTPLPSAYRRGMGLDLPPTAPRFRSLSLDTPDGSG